MIFGFWLWLGITFTTLDLPVCTSTHLIPGIDPRLYFDSSLDTDYCTSEYLTSVNDLGTNKGSWFDSLPGLHLTPARTVTGLKDHMEPADQPHISRAAASPLVDFQQQLLAMMQHLQTLTHQVMNLSHTVRAGQLASMSQTSYAPPAVSPPPGYPIAQVPEPHLPSPQRYDRGLSTLPYPVPPHLHPPAEHFPHGVRPSCIYHHAIHQTRDEVGHCHLGGGSAMHPDIRIIFWRDDPGVRPIQAQSQGGPRDPPHPSGRLFGVGLRHQLSNPGDHQRMGIPGLIRCIPPRPLRGHQGWAAYPWTARWHQ